jgi:Flp pilus assembly pilin Flp
MAFPSPSDGGAGTSLKENQVELITKMYVRTREWHKGQTMTEYALILAAVAVVVYAGYQAMGTSITSLLSITDGSI